ncbi:MAG: DUF4384 domain-containing protein [Nitrospira sp.]|nr:DUF4384 domain-containing protein [Nitrospira sp.]
MHSIEKTNFIVYFSEVKSISILIFLILMLLPQYVFSENIKIVESVGEAYLGEDTTPAEAKAIALNNARRSALEEAVGIVVHGSTVVYNSELISDLVFTATKGLIVKEKIIEKKCQTKDEQIYCLTKIEAHIKPLGFEKSGNLKILKASIQRPDKDIVIKSPVFQKGDEIQVKVIVNEDSFVSLFSVGQYGNISKLFPNDYSKQIVIPSEKEFIYPDYTQRSMGLKFRVHTPKGLKKAVESVLIIATKEETNLLSNKSIQNPTISDLMSELSEIDPSLWVEKTLGYEVRE